MFASSSLCIEAPPPPKKKDKENSGSQYISFKHYEWKVQMDLHLGNIAKYGHVDYKQGRHLGLVDY